MRRLFLLLAPLALLAAACTPPPPPGPVRVALLVPGGSADPQRNLIATSLVNAARLAEADLAGVEIDLAVYNTAGDPGRGAQVAQQALDEGARIIIGPLFKEVANAVGGVAAPAGVNVLSFSNDVTIAGGNVFVLGTTFQNVSDRLVGYAAGQGLRTVGVVYPDTFEGRLARAAVVQAAAGSGASVVAEGAYPFSPEGIQPQGPIIAQQMTAAGATAIVFTDTPSGGLPFITSQMRGLIPTSQGRFMGIARWSEGRGNRESLEGGWFPLPDPGLSQAFESRYRSAYGSAPHPLAGLSFDGVQAVGSLLRRGGDLSANRLTQRSGFAGSGGIFRLLPSGVSERALAIMEIRSGQAVIVDPAPRDFGGIFG